NDVVLRLREGAEPRDARIGLQTLYPTTVGVIAPPRNNSDVEAVPSDSAASIEWLNSLSDAELRRLMDAASSEHGRRIFGRDGAGCVRCHQFAEGSRGRGAPALRTARRQFTLRYLAESIVAPSKDVAAQYRRSTLVLIDGRPLRGLVVGEGAN